MATPKQRTQLEVLQGILTKLGYSDPNQIPVPALLDEKYKNGTLTVRESIVLDLYARGLSINNATQGTPVGKSLAEVFPREGNIMGVESPTPTSASSRINAVVNGVKKAGFELDTPAQDILNSRESLAKIAEVSKSIDPHWSAVWKSLNAFGQQNNLGVPYNDPKVMGKGLTGAKQTRGSRRFDKVPPADKAFPEIVAGLQTIEDTSTRNALVASFLAPYRPGEIEKLRLGPYDLSTFEGDAPPGYFDPETGKIVFPQSTRGKKTATDLTLDKNSILYQVLMAQSKEAEALGSTYLFPDVTTGSMTKAIQQNITPRMAQFEVVMKRPFDRAQDARKLISSLVVNHLGYPEEAEQLLGHSGASGFEEKIGAVSNKYYVSSIARVDNPLAATQLAIENMIGEAIGAQTLNETATALGLDIPGYTDDSAQPISITRSGEVLSEKIEVENRPLSAEELASLEARRADMDATLRLAAQEKEARALDLETQNLERDAELQSQRQAAAEQRQQQRALSKAEKEAQQAAEKAEAIRLDDAQADKAVSFFEKLLGRKMKPVISGLEAGATALGLSAAVSQEAEADPVTAQDVAVGAAKELTLPGMMADIAPEAGEVMEEAGGLLVDPVIESAEEEAEQKGIAGDFEAQMRSAFGIPR